MAVNEEPDPEVTSKTKLDGGHDLFCEGSD